MATRKANGYSIVQVTADDQQGGKKSLSLCSNGKVLNKDTALIDYKDGRGPVPYSWGWKVWAPVNIGKPLLEKPSDYQERALVRALWKIGYRSNLIIERFNNLGRPISKRLISDPRDLFNKEGAQS